MAQSLCPPLSESWLLSPGWGPARPPPRSDKDCGCSPASSPDSWAGLGSAAGAAASWGSPPACPGALAAPEPREPPVLYDEAACPESLAVELSPSSPLFPGDVLALLETWMPLSPPEWPPA
ncbi:mesoderm posterior protein 1 [Leptonychotes weddellii]|uniref:Mesoderm posterior protein 1 n=1 Tax=Leptonychotes weddellii TaxID=9713 RepID=A0A7F8RFD3_LEPWE|nr:mesoderm posterior protein 1 [Leptonychotes weddellii]